MTNNDMYYVHQELAKSELTGKIMGPQCKLHTVLSSLFIGLHCLNEHDKH